MKILHRYVLKQIFGVFFICLIVFTFVLFIGNLLKVIEMVSKGIGLLAIVEFLVLLLPFMFSYSIPVSILTAVLLVFARLSADNEITSIRASGINLKFVFKPIVLCSIIMVMMCYVINDQLRPNAIFAGRKLLVKIGLQEPGANITSGRFNEVFPGHVIYVGQRKGDLWDRVVVYKFEKSELNSVITAESGKLFFTQKGFKPNGKEDEGENVCLQLYNGILEEIPKEEQGSGKLNRIKFDTYDVRFNVEREMGDLSVLPKKEREMTNGELRVKIKDLRKKIEKADYQRMIPEIRQEISSIKTRIHNRIALSFSCLTFVLVAIPLGIRVHRSETSVGAGISLILVAVYYFLMTLGEAFQDNILLRPWLLMWIPNIALLIVGIILIHKTLRR